MPGRQRESRRARGRKPDDSAYFFTRHSAAYTESGIGGGPALVCSISREGSWNRFSFFWVTPQLRRPNDTWAASRNSETLLTTILGWKGCEGALTRRGLRDWNYFRVPRYPGLSPWA